MATDQSAVGLQPRWVAEKLAEHRRVAELPVVTFDSFLGTGQMSRTARFNVAWHDGAGPPSVVVKVPSTDDTTRQYGFGHGPYAAEFHFYRSVASETGVASAQSFGLHFDEAAPDFAFLLEDMTGHRPGDQFTEPDGSQLNNAVEQVVALQAPAWGRAGDEPFSTLTGDREGRATRTKAMLQAFLPSVVERLGGGLDNGIDELLGRFGDVSDELALHQSEPTTLVHGDFRPDNFMYGSADSPRPLVVVDWQTLRMGRGVTDIAYLLGGALAPNRRAQIERDTLADYRQRLSAVGIDYGHDDCLRDYAIASLHGLAVATAATLMAAATERGDALFTMMLNRHGRHAIEWNALEELAR